MIALANFNCLAVGAWLVGLLVVIGRRKEHPQVSAAIVWSTTCMFVAGCWSTYLGVGIWIDSQPSAETFMLAGMANFVLFSIGWGALLAAVLGWRQSPGSRDQPAPRLQFSIRGLLIFTLIVAVLCGLLRLVVWGLEIPPNYMPLLIGDVPFMLFWMVGAWQAWERRLEFPRASSALAWGVGIQAGSIITLVIFVVASRYLTIEAEPAVTMIFLLAVFAFFLAFPLSWIFFLTAALGYRDRRPPRNEVGVEAGSHRQAGLA